MNNSRWNKWLPLLMFGFIILVGGLLIAIFRDGFGGDVGIALIIAGVIGATIELTFVTKLAKHVFEIAFGYLLPKEIQDEVKWIYGINLIVEDYQHHFSITIHPENPEKVILNERWIRKIKNISSKSQPINPGLGVQEWFQQEGDSLVKSFTVTYDKHHFSRENGNTENDWDVSPPTVGVHIIKPDKIVLKKDETCTTEAEVEEIRYVNDQTYSFFSYAAKNPYVSVKVPNGFGYSVTFANRNQAELEDLGNGNHRLNGLVLPLQAIRIRWWRVDDLKKYNQRKADEKN